MNDEFLKSYQGLPTSLLNPTESIQPSALLAECRFDTRDCAHDTCSSDCVDCSDCSDCSDCYDTPKYTIIATVNFDAAGGLVSPTSITEKGYGRTKPYGTVSIDFPTPTRDGYIFLYWLLDGYTTHWPAGANDIYATSSGETYTARAQWKPSPKYTIIATVNFDAAGGLVSPTSITEKGYGRTKPYGTVSIDFPTPTRDGYIFLYWLLDGYTTHWPAGANDIYATSSGETYTARAQWEKQTAGKAFIGDGGVWKQAVPYIGYGGVWKPVSESIGDGGTWK